MIRSVRSLGIAAALVALVALPAACGGGGGGVSGRIDDYVTVEYDIIDIQCDCFAEYQYTTEADCINDNYEGLTTTERDCLIDAYTIDDTGLDFLDCILGAAQIYADCIDADLNCADSTSLDACDAEYEANFNQCPQPSADVSAAADACFPA